MLMELTTVENIQETLFVKPTYITCLEPTVFGGDLGSCFCSGNGTQSMNYPQVCRRTWFTPILFQGVWTASEYVLR
jgi:hypothetical protein